MKKNLVLTFLLFIFQFTYGQTTRNNGDESHILANLEHPGATTEINEEFSKYKTGDVVKLSYSDVIGSENQELELVGKCYATGIIEDLNPEKLELKVRLMNSCDARGTVIFRHDASKKVDGEFQEVKKARFDIMKEGETKWTSYYLWKIFEK